MMDTYIHTDIDVQFYVCLYIPIHLLYHTYDSIELVVNYYWFKT